MKNRTMSRKFLDSKNIAITTQRLCYEVIENHDDFSNSAIIGLQPRGVLFARKLRAALEKSTGKKILYGELDITFYRDDFRTREMNISANELKIDFPIEGKRIILVDDVLYTGRSVRSALDALNDFGRPGQVELLVLIDRLYNREFPIEADYIGKKVDTRADDKVKVDWEEDVVWILKK
jgi:pyrimidine operon attenuation protein/uracil phosphoribosyltransferase